MTFFTKRRIAVLASLLVAAIAAVGGWAYFTANGSGSATATVGTSSNLVLHGSTVGTLYPGATVPISFTVDNPSSGHQQLGTIYLAGVKACTGAGSSWDPSLNSGAGGCSNSGTEQTTCESVDAGNAGDANAEQLLPGRRDREPGSRRQRDRRERHERRHAEAEQPQLVAGQLQERQPLSAAGHALGRRQSRRRAHPGRASAPGARLFRRPPIGTSQDAAVAASFSQMRRAAGLAFRSRIWLGLAGIPLAFVLGVPVALGFFGSPGSGHATAALGTLTAPAAPTATPGAGTVVLSWSSVSPPTGSGTVSYYVQRDGANAGGNCPTQTSPSTSHQLHRLGAFARHLRLHSDRRLA